MAHEEPILTEPQSQDVTAHVRDYAFFTKLVKWTLVVALALGFIVLWILK